MKVGVEVKFLLWGGFLVPHKDLQACSTTLSKWILTTECENQQLLLPENQGQLRNGSKRLKQSKCPACVRPWVQSTNHPLNLAREGNGPNTVTELQALCESLASTWRCTRVTNLILTSCFGHTHSFFFFFFYFVTEGSLFKFQKQIILNLN